MVALEAVRAMFGAPYPKADASIRKKTGEACGVLGTGIVYVNYTP